MENIFFVSHRLLLLHSPEGSQNKLPNMRQSENVSHIALLKSDSHLSKKLCDLLHRKPIRNDEKRFLFDLKSSFRSQDI